MQASHYTGLLAPGVRSPHQWWGSPWSWLHLYQDNPATWLVLVQVSEQRSHFWHPLCSHSCLQEHEFHQHWCDQLLCHCMESITKYQHVLQLHIHQWFYNNFSGFWTSFSVLQKHAHSLTRGKLMQTGYRYKNTAYAQIILWNYGWISIIN